MSSLKVRPYIERIWGLSSWRMRWKSLTEGDSGGDPTRVLAESQKACPRKVPARVIASTHSRDFPMPLTVRLDNANFCK